MKTEADLKKDFARFVKLSGASRVAKWAGVSAGHAARWQRQEFLPKPHHTSLIWQCFQREFEHDEAILRAFIHNVKELEFSKPTAKSSKKPSENTA